MKSSILQRLIGACVLAAIIALLWSVVFEDYDPQKLDQKTQIPEAPAFEKFEVEGGSILVKKQREAAELAKQKSDSAQAKAAKPSEAKEPKPSEAKVKGTKLTQTDSKKNSQKTKAQVSGTKAVDSLANNASEKLAKKPQQPKLPPVKSAPKFNDKGVPVTWEVQVGSFASEQNAQKLLKRLIDKNYKAYIRTNKNGDKTIYRLKIGPFIELAKAKQVNSEIKRHFKLDGLVSRYKVH